MLKISGIGTVQVNEKKNLWRAAQINPTILSF